MSKMESISCKEVRDHMADVINRVAFKAQKFTLTRHGSAVAVLLSLEEWDEINKMVEQKEDKEDIRDADLAFKKHSKKRGMSLKAMKKKLGI
jgi:prevent-host-death family protein